MIEFRICRFCGDYGDRDRLLKYGVRHYAHADCGLSTQGAAFFDNFTTWQLEHKFPALVAHRLGLLRELEHRIGRTSSYD